MTTLRLSAALKLRYQPRRVQLLEFGNTVVLRENLLAPCIIHAVSRLFILENRDVSCLSITALYYSSKQMQIMLGMMENCCLPSANIYMRQWFQLVITLHISLFYFPNTKILQNFLLISMIYNTLKTYI